MTKSVVTRASTLCCCIALFAVAACSSTPNGTTGTAGTVTGTSNTGTTGGNGTTGGAATTAGTTTSNSTTGSNAGNTTGGTTSGCQAGQCIFGDGTCGWNVAGDGPCGLPGVNGNLNCCSGLTCQSDNVCEPASTGTTGGTGSNNGCQGDAGATCVTNADCITTLCSVTASQAQTGPSAVGVCDIPPTPQAFNKCGAAGSSCGAVTDAPCCGYCGSDTFCHDLPHACGAGGATCANNDDCCANFACSGTTCTPTCGQNLSACDPANNNSDCCTSLGFTCVPAYVDAGGTIIVSVYGANVCYNTQGQFEAANPAAACQSPAPSNFCGDAGECLLGSVCAPVTVQGQTDECGAAGLACDFTDAVCRNPQWQEFCNPAGPACDYSANSRDNSFICENPGNAFTESDGTVVPPFCNELCSSSNDCMNPLSQCYPLGAPVNQSICLFYSQTVQGGAGCTNYFGTCNAAGTNDGVCLQVQAGRGECWQAATTGGAAGAACSDNANRQNPAFCDLNDFCIGNICDQFCDPQGGSPTCPATATCVGVSGTTPPTYGVCAVGCDFLAADGGGCSTGQKCALPVIFGLADGPTGACIGLNPTAPALGEVCTPGFPDPCGIGMTCEGGDTVYGGNITGYWCHQSCNNPGGTCADTTACIGYQVSATVTTTAQGYCAGTATWPG